MAPADSSPDVPRIGIPVTLYVLTLLASIFVLKSYRPHGLMLAVTIAVPVAALAWMVVRCRAAARLHGPMSHAVRNYLRRFLPLMVAYVALLFAANWLTVHYRPSGLTAIGIAILPALPLIGVVLVVGKLVTEEKDEYLRLQHIRQILVATGFLLVVSCIWGFLEDFGQVPHVPAYWAFITWCAGLGLGSTYNEWRP